MNLSEALSQAKGMTITDLTVKIVKAFPVTTAPDGSWSRMDMRGEDTTIPEAVIKLWNPTFTPEDLMGKTVTISARPNAKNQWVGAKTEVWEKQDGSVQAQVSVDGDHLSLFGAEPAQQPVPTVQVNADVQPVAAPVTTTHPPMAAAPGSAKDLCQLIADLHEEIYKKLNASAIMEGRDEIMTEAGTHARTLFIELAKTGRLVEAGKEFDVPF